MKSLAWMDGSPRDPSSSSPTHPSQCLCPGRTWEREDDKGWQLRSMYHMLCAGSSLICQAPESWQALA